MSVESTDLNIIDNPRMYIIDTGAICFYMMERTPLQALEKILLFSAAIKPSIYATHQPIISISKPDIVVCNIGDSEIRIYPKPATIEILPEHYYLSAPFNDGSFTSAPIPQNLL